MKTRKTKVLVIGWDGADWKVASPLMDQGKMPHLQRMVDDGVMGNISTLYPVLSPMLWTSIATGKRAHKHGIYGFVEPDPQSGAVRPITNLGRKCKAIWNILNQQGLRSNVVGWWPSHPAEPIDGVMVSNHFQKSVNPADQPWPMRHGTVHPAGLAASLAKFRVHPGEIEGEQLLPFVPDAASVDQEKDRRLNAIAEILAETAGVQAVATAIMQHEPWDFMGVYFDAIDHFCHGFMKYHPPRETWVDEKDFELYHKVIDTAYQFHDIMLGALLELAGEETTVILVSDHGFHPDHLRPRMIGNEPAGPADEHRQFGVFAMKGPGIRNDGLVFGASLLDVTPTILTLFDLPVGADMDGRPLVSAFENEPEIRFVDSWEAVPGNDGRHPPGLQVDAIDAHESLQQLVDLGYIDAPDEDSEQAATNAKRELRYNLARDYFDARMIPEATRELQALWDECPDESRFGVRLFNCWLGVGNTERAEATLDRLVEAKTAYAEQARAELKRLKAERERDDNDNDDDGVERAAADNAAQEQRKKDAQKLRRLVRRAQVNPAAFAYFRGCLHHAKGEFDEALQHLVNAQNVQVYNQPSLKQKMGECYLGKRDWDKARKCFEQILVIDPISAQAQLGLAQTALGHGRPRQAYAAACAAVGLIYHNPKAHYIAARALSELGRLNKASEHLETALAQSPAFADAHRLAAMIARKRGDPARAETHDAQALAAGQRIADLRDAKVTPQEREPGIGVAMDRAIGIGTITAKSNRGVTAPLIVVSGLPRSGTSMMMQMLAAAGIPTLTDDHRPADASNPRGYYEFEPVRKLSKQQHWVRDAGGKAVKVVAQLLPSLPADSDNRIIFMARPLGEVVGSQAKMLRRLGRAGAAVPAHNLAASYSRQVDAVAAELSRRHRLAAITVSYNEAIRNPAAVAKQVNEFLGGHLDEAAMAAAIDASLYRERLAAQG